MIAERKSGSDAALFVYLAFNQRVCYNGPKGVERKVYDFNRCKLCAKASALPKYKLKKAMIYVCGSCGFHYIDYLDIMPSGLPDENQLILDDKSRAYIEAMLVPNGKQHRENLLLVKQYCHLPESRCLDIGAGAGLFSSLLSQQGAFVRGIEPQKIFRDFALARFGITLNRETIDNQYWQKDYAGFFDLAALWDVLEHVNFPVETIERAYAVIKPGGWLFLDTPCRDSIFYKIGELSYRFNKNSGSPLLGSFYSANPFRHKQIFSRSQLTDLVEKTGFKVVRINPSFLKMQNKMTLVCQKPLSAE